MEKNEFGMFDMQMRVNIVVKNATVFEVVRGCFFEVILVHGDVDENDLQKLANSGRTFFVFPEMGAKRGDAGWQDFWVGNRSIRPTPAVHLDRRHSARFFMKKNDVEEFRSFARVIVMECAIIKQRARRFA